MQHFEDFDGHLMTSDGFISATEAQHDSSANIRTVFKVITILSTAQQPELQRNKPNPGFGRHLDVQ